MSLWTNWLKSLNPMSPRRKAARKKRLGLEALEGREVPATLQILDGVLSYTAANGVANKLEMTANAFNYTFTDAVEAINVVGIAGTTGSGTKVVTVPVSAIPAAGIAINLGDRSDALTLHSSLHAVSVKAGTDHDTIDVGTPVGGVLVAISAPVTVDGEAGTDTIRVNDPSGFLGAYTVTANQVTRIGNGYTFGLTYANADNLALNGGFFADTFDIRATAAGTRTTVNGGTGNDTFRIGNAANTLDDIQGTLTINGGANDANFEDQVTFMDQGSAARSYTFRADQILARTGSAMIAYAGMERMTLNAGGFGDSIGILATPANMPLTLNLGAGNDTVTVGSSAYSLANIGGRLTVNGEAGTDRVTLNDQANAAPTAYTINHGAVNRGFYNTLMNHAAMEGLTLIAGTDDDWIDVNSVSASQTVAIRAGAGNDYVQLNEQGVNGVVSVDGEAGTDMLSYFHYTADVRVNLARGTATNVAGGVRNMEDVSGGAGNDIIVGNDALNVLWGNMGRDILIGRAGADQIIAEHGDDILVGDSTAHDLSPSRLEDLMREWVRTDLPGFAKAQYRARVEHLLGTAPGGLNGTTTLTPAQVTSDGVADFLDGGQNLDWYFTTGTDVTAPLEPREYVNAAPNPSLVGDLLATVVSGSLFITEDIDSEGLNHTLRISRQPNGNTLLTALHGSVINGMTSVEFAVPWGLFVNLAEGEDAVIFDGSAGQGAAFAGGVTILMGEGDARDRVITSTLEPGLVTAGSLTISTGGGNDSVTLNNSVIGDGLYNDQLIINTGTGADAVRIHYAVQINGTADIQTYAAASEVEADFVYFDLEAHFADLNVRTGAGDDLLTITDEARDIVQWVAMRVGGSFTVDLGTGDDKAYVRSLAVAGNFTLYTGAGADDVMLDNRLIDDLVNLTTFRPRVGGNLVVQTYESLTETDSDEVTLLDGSVVGSLAVRMGGGDDRFRSEYLDFVGDDMVVNLGDGSDEAEVSAFVMDLLMVILGGGDDQLHLGKTWAEHLVADGGSGHDTLTKAYNTKANNFYLFGWEVQP